MFPGRMKRTEVRCEVPVSAARGRGRHPRPRHARVRRGARRQRRRVGGAPLHPARSATTLRIRDEETLLTDGPYAELKEQLGGYYLLECADLDEAVRWAATIPAAPSGAVEVRPLM